MSSGLAQSAQVRLVRHAKAIDADPNLVFARYAAERLLYRLSRSAHAERFVLKGAMLLVAWLGENIRPTRDMDLLGPSELGADVLADVVRDVFDTDVEPDGLVFDPASVRIEPIRADGAFGGWRVLCVARLGSARIRTQVDIGIGDLVSPEPEWL